MKRAGFDHPKLKALAKELTKDLRFQQKFGVVIATGVLERLWNFTAKYAIQGDIGKRSDEDIADGIGWPIELAHELTSALVRTSWLDVCPTSRLVVHDWPDHCDSSVTKTLKNRGLQFIFPETSQTFPPKPLPLPLKPEPLPLDGKGSKPEDPKTEPPAPNPDQFDRYWTVFEMAGKALNEEDKIVACRAFVSLESDQREAAIANAEVLARERDAGMLPMPVSHLTKRPWTRVALPRALPPPQNSRMGPQSALRGSAAARDYKANRAAGGSR